MKIDLAMRQAQEQRLLLLPQMLQAIEILQLSSQDLMAMVERELAENETLEIADPQPDVEQPPETAESDEPDLPDDDWEPGDTPRAASSDDDRDFIGQVPAQQLSLHGHLLEQLSLTTLDEKVREIVAFLIGSLDRNGHLALTEAEIAAVFPDRDDERIEEALIALRSFDPLGVGYANPRESMLAQLDPLDPDSDYLALLINHHLEDLAKNRFPKVAKALGLSVEELKSLLVKLKALDPCPGKAFDTQEAELLRPDVVVRREEGEWQVYVDDSRVPPLRIRSEYEKLANDRHTSKRVRKYLKGKLGSAKDLMASIEQRRDTLGRVARAIVDRQTGFLERGRPGLRPLKMQEIADAIGVHLSTVSRATSHKTIQTDFGIFPLRGLFDGGKPVGGNESGEGGEARASVKDRIRRLIGSEDPKHPFSDDRIVELLGQDGLQIARRTVAKYRKELGIPSSWRRKQH